MKKNVKLYISFTALVLWMALIFWFSSRDVIESRSQSKGIVEAIEKVIKAITSSVADTNKKTPIVTDHLIRKTAHFMLFLVLGFLSLCVCHHYGKLRYNFIGSSMFCLLYAMSDEFHQSFVPGRGPQVTDVMIDFCGSLLGILICLLILKRRKKIN